MKLSSNYGAITHIPADHDENGDDHENVIVKSISMMITMLAITMKMMTLSSRRASAYLIFVTDPTGISVEKNNCHVEKFQISVHDRCG